MISHTTVLKRLWEKCKNCFDDALYFDVTYNMYSARTHKHSNIPLQENMELRFEYEQARKENPRLKVSK